MLKIGTDFSGIGSPEQALKKLGIKHKSMFACDVDKYAKQSFLANHKTEQFYDDITTRNHKETPYVDLYVAGFPCQSFSMAGKRKSSAPGQGWYLAIREIVRSWGAINTRFLGHKYLH